MARTQLCLDRALPKQEIYRTCPDRFPPGTAPPLSMATARFNSSGRMIALERLEAHPRRHDAETHFRAIVKERTEMLGRPSEEAKQYYRSPPDTALVWRVWRTRDGKALISVALLPDTEGPDIAENVVVVAEPTGQ